jgi:phospholipase/carboxylesterase
LTGEGIIDPARVFLLGFSQTCALNYRFAFTHARHLRGVVGICGGLPGDWETGERYQNTEAAVLHLAGARDEFYPPTLVAGYAARLAVRARDAEVRSYDAGHELTPAMRADVRAWLEARI